MSFLTVAAPTTGNISKTQPENRIHYPALDGLRAIALCLVFGAHYAALPWGYTGVDLFFVLSGFLITGILYDSVDRPDRFRTFYIRRSLRIFPLYYGLFAALLLLTPLLHFRWSRWWLVWPLYLGNIVRFIHPYNHNPVFLAAANGWLFLGRHNRFLSLGHFWSLSLEEQFYLAWPWVVFSIGQRRKLVQLCAAVVLLWPLLRIIVLHCLPVRYTQLELTYSFTPLRIDALLIGGLLALLIRGAHRQAVLKFCKWICAIALPLVLLYLLRTVHLHQPYAYPYARLTWGASVIDLIAVAIVALALVPGSIIYCLCSHRWLRWLGTISYGAYVFHDIPHNLYSAVVDKLSPRIPLIAHHNRLSVLLLGAAGTLLLAQLSFRYIESPILNLKERWAPSR